MTDRDLEERQKRDIAQPLKRISVAEEPKPLDRKTKLLFGRLLGEIYRLQRRQDESMVPAGPGEIYGLIQGFDWVVDQVLETFGTVTEKDLKAVADLFDHLEENPMKLKKLTGFYDIEEQLSARGINREKAMALFTYFRAGDKFAAVLDALDRGNSPGELQRLKPHDTEI